MFGFAIVVPPGSLQRVHALYDGKKGAVEAGGCGGSVLKAGSRAYVVAGQLSASSWHRHEMSGDKSNRKHERYTRMELQEHLHQQRIHMNFVTSHPILPLTL